MPSKLLKFVLSVARMKTITADKVADLTEKNYPSIKIYESKSTAPSIFVNVVQKHILKVPAKEREKLYTACNKLGKVFYDVPKSRDQFFTKIRKPILQKYKKGSKEYNQSLDYMKLEKKERDELNKDSKSKVKKANKNRPVYYSEDLMNIIEETKGSADYATEAIGLMLASGCRPIELFDKNKFKPTPELGNNWVEVLNIAKKQEQKKDYTTKRPIIGYTANQFIKAISNFRKKVPRDKTGLYITEGSDKGQLKKKYGQKISRVMNEKYFSRNETPKMLRKLYGNLAHLLFAPTSNLNIFLGEVLGHDEEDQNTSFSYSTVRVLIGNKDANSENSNIPDPESKVETERLTKRNDILQEEIKKLTERVDNQDEKLNINSPCKPNLRNLSNAEKEKRVKETIQKMVQQGQKISQERVSCVSQVSWRICRGLVREWKAKNGLNKKPPVKKNKKEEIEPRRSARLNK